MEALLSSTERVDTCCVRSVDPGTQAMLCSVVFIFRNPLVTRATKKLMSLCEVFDEKLVKRACRAKQEKRQKAEKTQQLSGECWRIVWSCVAHSIL